MSLQSRNQCSIFYLLLEFKMPNFKMLFILWIIYKHGEFIGIYNCIEDKKNIILILKNYYQQLVSDFEAQKTWDFGCWKEFLLLKRLWFVFKLLPCWTRGSRMTCVGDREHEASCLPTVIPELHLLLNLGF